METKRQERQKKSDIRQEWENSKKVEFSTNYKKLSMQEHEILEALDKFFDDGTGYIIDMFPKRVPIESKYYEEVEQYLLSNIITEFSSKCLSIVMKLMCYYPYDTIITHYYEEDGDEVKKVWNAYSWYDLNCWKILLEDLFIKNGRIHFLFEEEKMMIALYCDELIANVFLSESNNTDITELLKELTVSQGLYLKNI